MSLRSRNRVDYAVGISNSSAFKGHIFARIYGEGANYLDRTAYAVADALFAYAQQQRLTDVSSVVTIDGLKDTEARMVGKVLRRRGVSLSRLRGARDESTVLIRLADSVAGLLRDAVEGDQEFANVVSRLKKSGIVSDILSKQKSRLAAVFAYPFRDPRRTEGTSPSGIAGRA